MRRPCPGFLLTAALAAVTQTGCGVLIQTAVGWSATEERTETRTHRVQIDSDPKGATLLRREQTGELTALGVTPTTDDLVYTERSVYKDPKWGAVFFTGLAELIAGVAMVGVSASDSDVEAGVAVTGGVSILGGSIDTIVGLIQLIRPESLESRSADRVAVQYAAAHQGRSSNGVVQVPDQSHLFLQINPLSGGLGVTEPAPVLEPAPAAPRPHVGWVTAVMQVRDRNAAREDRALDPELVSSLTDQMRIFVAEQGVQVVDRGAQDAALSEEILRMKTDSYNSCYDESCQIELGKALAATHILRAHIARFGDTCTLNAELIDLTKEVTVSAASSKGPCKEEGFLDMSQDVAQRLFR